MSEVRGIGDFSDSSSMSVSGIHKESQLARLHEMGNATWRSQRTYRQTLAV